MELHGKIVEARLLREQEIEAMFSLMEEFYDDTVFGVFLEDLKEKDYCILLYDEENRIQGFSTQKIMSVYAGDEEVFGVFSGDTVIHKDHWGSLELFKLFAQYFISYGQRHKYFYWFLISKGYKTYKMLPVFFKEFYPNYKDVTPLFEQSIMDSFGRLKYPGEYNEATGVINYNGVKDKLKAGVADITEKLLKDKNILQFIKLNPDYFQGNDLVCTAKLTEENLKPGIRRLLLGK